MRDLLARLLGAIAEAAERISRALRSERPLTPNDVDEAWAREAIATSPEMYSFASLKHTAARREVLERLEAGARVKQRLG